AGRTADFKAALRSPRIISMAALTAALISVNWGIYVWAIAVDRTIETALGYYINPLVSVVVGALLLGERLDRLPIGPSQGFLLEVLLLSVPALGYIILLIVTGQDHFVSSSLNDTALLIGCGPVTAIPLLLFAFGAKLLRLSTIGIMQYIAPTIVFLIAVLIFGEPFGSTQAIAFGLIWTALAIYSWSMFSSARKAGATPRAPAA
ncbi:MAG: EamA family transporter RarD, partial [Mesorhizobium sp.]